MTLFENNIRTILKFVLSTVLITNIMTTDSNAQNDEWALETATMKMGQIFIGVVGGGGKSSFNFSNGFFPNDYNLIGFRGQQGDATMGSGYEIGVKYWPNPYTGLIDTLPVYGLRNEYSPVGRVTERMTNYVRYKYPSQEIDFSSVDLPEFGEYDPTKFEDYSYDQVIEVTNEYIYGIELKKKIMVWSQQYNDNYIIFDLEFENKSDYSFDSLYIGIEGNQPNSYLSNGRNPYVPQADQYNKALVWQHYYGGREGDSLRVFYEYSAHDPKRGRDNMGAPAVSQGGRLVGADMFFYSILHASKEPYLNASEDSDDFTQPRITYVGTATKIPTNPDQDEFGNKNYWAVSGGYSDLFPMIGDVIPETHHGGNTDEHGTDKYYAYPAGTDSNPNSKMVSSFGPYNMTPGQKIRLVYAIGYAGLGLKKAKEIGENWLKDNLEDPPNLPNSETGYFPSNFVFPAGALERDKIKDRWVSTAIDSVMKTAYRAKWNFDHEYKIPQAPPPPSKLSITGHGDGVELIWEDLEAEAMPNFAGYRIMRRRTSVDTMHFEVIYDSDENDIASEHLYKDKTILVGAEYYYYLQSKARVDENDAFADPTTRGKIIYSSRLLVPQIPDIHVISPPRPPQDDLSKVRIVPNPYNLNDPDLEGYFGADRRGIIFINLPGTCTIKIYSENGDLVRTLINDSPVKTGFFSWDMLTSSQQVVNSGLYIAVIEKPSGEMAYHKFIVIR
jgi:hypothetical protein